MPESVWKPNPGSQKRAFDINANEVFYWGDRGPGKTSWQIARALSRFFIGYGKYYKVLLMGLKIKSLQGCVAEVQLILPKLEEYYRKRCRSSRKEGDWRWEAETGEEFRIVNLKTIDQAEDMVGQQYNVQCWNELCHYPSPRLYIMLSGSNRSPFIPEKDTPKDAFGEYLTPDKKPLPPCPEEILSTANTRGDGKLWVRKKYIDPIGPTETRHQYRQINTTYKIRGKTEVVTTVSLQGTQGENPRLTSRYLAMLREQTKHDPALHREWCGGGDWYTPSGGAFDHVWDADKHVIMGDIKIPPSWYCNVTVYFSSSLPTCVVWSAETDVPDKIGNYEFPAGSVLFLHELYFCSEGDPHLGTKISIRDLAKTIVKTSGELAEKGILYETVVDGFGSRNLFLPIAGGMLSDRLADGGVFVDEMGETGYKTDMRELGLAVVRERLTASANGEEDGIYFSEHCKNCIRTLPDLAVDDDNPEVISEAAELYCYEAVRIRAMSMCAPTEDLAIG